MLCDLTDTCFRLVMAPFPYANHALAQGEQIYRVAAHAIQVLRSLLKDTPPESPDPRSKQQSLTRHAVLMRNHDLRGAN
jgi:hypothetical protein